MKNVIDENTDVKEFILTVTVENEPAHSMYMKMGFEIVKSDQLLCNFLDL